MQPWKIFVACLALTLAGPLYAAQAADSIRSVGIISAIGDTMVKQSVGRTVFDNSEGQEAVESWKIDEFVIAEFTAQLSGLYEVKSVAYSKADFAAKQKGIVVDSDFDGQASIKHVTPAPGAEPDAYIIGNCSRPPGW